MTATALPIASTLTGAGVTEATFKTQLTAIRAALAEMGDPLGQFAAPQNLALALSVAGNALTIALKTRALADADADNTIAIPFRNATAATGDFTVIDVAAASSLVVSSGSTLGTANSTAFRLWFVGFNDAGTFRLGVINCLSGTSIYPLRDDVLASSTAEGGAGAADSAHVIYTGTAVTAKAMRVLGYAEWSSGLATAGTWSGGPTKVQLFGPGISLPGMEVQVQRNATGAAASGTTVVPYDDTIPQNTEGDQYLSQAITPTSAANVLEIRSELTLANSAVAANVFTTSLFQDATANALAVQSEVQSAQNAGTTCRVSHDMRAGTVGATTFKVRAGLNGAGTTTLNGISGGRIFGGVGRSFLSVTERMA